MDDLVFEPQNNGWAIYEDGTSLRIGLLSEKPGYEELARLLQQDPEASQGSLPAAERIMQAWFNEVRHDPDWVRETGGLPSQPNQPQTPRVGETFVPGRGWIPGEGSGGSDNLWFPGGSRPSGFEHIREWPPEKPERYFGQWPPLKAEEQPFPTPGETPRQVLDVGTLSKILADKKYRFEFGYYGTEQEALNNAAPGEEAEREGGKGWTSKLPKGRYQSEGAAERERGTNQVTVQGSDSRGNPYWYNQESPQQDTLAFGNNYKAALDAANAAPGFKVGVRAGQFTLIPEAQQQETIIPTPSITEQIASAIQSGDYQRALELDFISDRLDADRGFSVADAVNFASQWAGQGPDRFDRFERLFTLTRDLDEAQRSLVQGGQGFMSPAEHARALGRIMPGTRTTQQRQAQPDATGVTGGQRPLDEREDDFEGRPLGELFGGQSMEDRARLPGQPVRAVRPGTGSETLGMPVVPGMDMTAPNTNQQLFSMTPANISVGKFEKLMGREGTSKELNAILGLNPPDESLLGMDNAQLQGFYNLSDKALDRLRKGAESRERFTSAQDALQQQVKDIAKQDERRRITAQNLGQRPLPDRYGVNQDIFKRGAKTKPKLPFTVGVA